MLKGHFTHGVPAVACSPARSSRAGGSSNASHNSPPCRARKMRLKYEKDRSKKAKHLKNTDNVMSHCGTNKGVSNLI